MGAGKEESRPTVVRFHDLRSECAPRLVEKGVPLSQVRDLLGRCSIVVTERYGRQVPVRLKEAAGRWSTFQGSFNMDDQASAVESVSSTH
jgi:integrase